MTNAPSPSPAVAPTPPPPEQPRQAAPEPPTLPEGFRAVKIGAVILVPESASREAEAALYGQAFWQRALELIPELPEGLAGSRCIAAAPLFRQFRQAPEEGAPGTIEPPPPVPAIYEDGGYRPGQSTLVAAWDVWAAKYPDTPEAAQHAQRARRERVRHARAQAKRRPEQACGRCGFTRPCGCRTRHG